MLTPVAKRVIIKPVEEKAGALLITNQKPKKFTVISIGDDVTNVKPGNIVFLEKYYGVEIEHDGDHFTVIDESSILAKVD